MKKDPCPNSDGTNESKLLRGESVLLYLKFPPKNCMASKANMYMNITQKMVTGPRELIALPNELMIRLISSHDLASLRSLRILKPRRADKDEPFEPEVLTAPIISSTVLAITTKQSKTLNPSLKYCLNPNAIHFKTISITKIMVSDRLTLSNIALREVGKSGH